MLISYHVTITITLSPLEQKQDHPISSDSYVDQQALSVLKADLKSSKSGFMAIIVIILHNVQWMTVYVTEPMFSFHILCFFVVIYNLYTSVTFHLQAMRRLRLSGTGWGAAFVHHEFVLRHT